MALKGVSAPAVAATGAGALFIWSGLKGAKLSTSARSLLQGKQPAGTNVNPIAGTPAALGSNVTYNTGTTLGPSVTGGSTQGDGIASDALRYKGTGYVWGGAPAKGIGNWDCSSFANWVCGHDEGLPIPGLAAGHYSGASHGPTTLEWMSWSGLTTVGHQGSVARPGDLAVWQTHMGICLGPNSMISAQTPQSGTQVSAIDGFIPEILFIRRYR